MKPGEDTRAKALEILLQYEKEGKKLGPLLLSVQEDKGLLQRDRAFIKALVEGVVERSIALDWVADQVSKVKTRRMKPVIRMIIRMGTYQLLFMSQVPDAAAVNEAVKLTEMKHIDSLKPFVNGVLRAVARYRDEGIEYPDAGTEYSCPAWIAGRLEALYGRDKALAAMKAGTGSRPLYLRANACLIDAAGLIPHLKGEGIKAEETGEEYTLKVRGGGLIPKESPSFLKGLYSVQDLSSQLAVYELWKQLLVYINDGKIVDINAVDLCASPGGKTCFLGELLGRLTKDRPGTDFHIKACDISEGKLWKIAENIKRTGLKNIETMVNDARSRRPGFEGLADVIIADLPCSGLGVMGRKVDIKYRVKPEDIDALCKLQRGMLDHVPGYLKPGGILMFSVCTVTEEETVRQSEYLENTGLHKISERLFLQGTDPCDGFYYSLWKKV